MNTRFRDLVLNTFSVILIHKVVIVAMSSFWKVMMKVFPRKIILIRNGIELRTANYGGKKKGRGGDLRLGSITRFSPDRNPFRFLDLIFHMNTCKVDYSVLMHIVGYGELQKTFEAQISKMGLMDSFRIMSYDYDKLEFFSNLDIYIGINVGDTSGLAALEAIANRVPVLSFQNLTMHDGGEDWIPSFVGVAELTKAIHELAINTTAYENLVQRQWNYLSRHHTIENMVEGYLEVYRLHGVQNKGGLVR
jgi:glycosyltransferase involved in cell wall biosynthesis